MDFNQMISHVQKRYDIKIVQLRLQTKIEHILLLSDDIDEWRNDTLYLGDSSFLPTDQPLSIHAILCNDKSNMNLSSHSNIALIHEKNLNSVFNQISKHFYHTLHVSNEFSKLVAMLMRGESVTTIMNTVADQLENPAIVVDTSFHVLSYSNNHKITDPFWTENIKRGYCTYEFITAVNEIIANQETPNDSASFIVHCPASPKSKICSKIIWNHQIVGYTIMLEEDTPLQEFQFEFLPKISYIIADLLSKNPEFESIQGSNLEHLLYDLLNGEDENNIRARMNALKLVFPERMRCIVLGPKQNNNVKQNTDNLHLLRFYKEKLNTIFPNSDSTFYKENLLIIVKVDTNEKFSIEQEEHLIELFTKGISTISISQSFDTIFSLPRQLKDCIQLQLCANQMGITKQLMYYEDYIFETILNMAHDSYQSLTCIHPALATLRDYDIQTDSSLYETLRVYLTCKYNLKQTSANLFIHRNSLTYRMEKILELTRLNLDDMNTLFWLEMSYRMEKFLGGAHSFL